MLVLLDADSIVESTGTIVASARLVLRALICG